jgi:hypothetical protein
VEKAQRVTMVASEDPNTTSYRVLRSGKRIHATPAAKKAVRVVQEPPQTVDKKPLRVPVTQVPSAFKQ